MNVENNLKKALHDLTESYETGLALMTQFEEKCSSAVLDVEFVSRSLPFIRSNEKLISLYRSIVEELVSIASASINSQINSHVPATQSIEDESVLESSVEVEPLSIDNSDVAIFSECVDAIEECHENGPSIDNGSFSENNSVTLDESNQERTIERKFEVNGEHEQSFVDPAMTSAINLSRKQKKLKKLKKLANFTPKSSKLSTNHANRIRDGNIRCFRVWQSKTTHAMCFFCDEYKSFSKDVWQTHLLTHTKEHLYWCRTCENNFTSISSHKTCSAKSFQTIYEQYNCSGDNYLSAFICKICNYVQVSERNLISHLRGIHLCRRDQQQFYQKCELVRNLQ